MSFRWSDEDKVRARDLFQVGELSIKEVAEIFQTTYDSVRHMIKTAPDEIPEGHIPRSIFPRYDRPPVMETEGVLVLPDPEVPFHDADWMNQLLDLAAAWEIKDLFVGGDLFHFHSLSSWEPAWTSGVSSTPNIAMEIRLAKRTIKRLVQQFDRAMLILGNHEGRFLRAIGSPFFPEDLLSLMQMDKKKWTIAPYYFGIIVSSGEEYQVEHPKNSAAKSARDLAEKFHRHILMCHSHKMDISWDRSGKYMACHIGACVDEFRLEYASQRHHTAPAHQLGAAIIRNGYLWVLNKNSDFESLKYAKPRQQEPLAE